MGKEKAGFLTPKAISNRIKSKGLQKLRWYCQMCQKQCRDENGFKCHTMSESHQRQLLLFADCPKKYMGEFSGDFLKGFMDILSRSFGTRRVHCNQVYQQYISDKNHVHMNGTAWTSLTGFVQFLGKTGRAKVDETEKGWFIQYIDRSPAALKREAATSKKEKMSRDDEDFNRKQLLRQVERAKEKVEDVEVEYTELQRENEDETLKLDLALKAEEDTKKYGICATRFSGSYFRLDSRSLPAGDVNALEEAERKNQERMETASTRSFASTVLGTKRKSALDDIREMEEMRKEKYNRKDHWLHDGIVVKVVTKKLGDKYYKQKGVIRASTHSCDRSMRDADFRLSQEVVDDFGAVVKMLDTGDKIKLDQAHLETVIPATGKPVLVVNGAYRGSEAVLLKLNKDSFSCTIRIDKGPCRGREVTGVQYEDVSKLH